MKIETLFLIYLIIINLLSGIVFATDKQAAIKNRRRIPERTLHILELAGGVFAVFLLMYGIHHKNWKFSYWVWTWIVMMGWIIGIYIYCY
jgi:uncharacterized membrane protein YsdA (DUF1294 family)